MAAIETSTEVKTLAAGGILPLILKVLMAENTNVPEVDNGHLQ
jgi:hypothetical protein